MEDENLQIPSYGFKDEFDLFLLFSLLILNLFLYFSLPYYLDTFYSEIRLTGYLRSEMNYFIGKGGVTFFLWHSSFSLFSFERFFFLVLIE